MRPNTSLAGGKPPHNLGPHRLPRVLMVLTGGRSQTHTQYTSCTCHPASWTFCSVRGDGECQYTLHHPQPPGKSGPEALVFWSPSMSSAVVGSEGVAGCDKTCTYILNHFFPLANLFFLCHHRHSLLPARSLSVVQATVCLLQAGASHSRSHHCEPHTWGEQKHKICEEQVGSWQQNYLPLTYCTPWSLWSRNIYVVSEVCLWSVRCFYGQ